MAEKNLFWGHFEFYDETGSSFWKKEKGNRHRLVILQGSLMPNFNFLCHKVQPTVPFKINKGHVAKTPKESKNSHK